MIKFKLVHVKMCLFLINKMLNSVNYMEKYKFIEKLRGEMIGYNDSHNLARLLVYK